MPPFDELIHHWGYAAIFIVLVLGNIGVPLPEEGLLLVAGYLAWRGDLHVAIVVPLAIVGAVLGDNLGYWLGRRYGREVVPRWIAWLAGSTARAVAMQAFVARYGMRAVFVARFVAGLRFAAGPLAGSLGLGFLPFVTGNVLGAVVYVPLMVGAGYLTGLGLGAYIEPAQRVLGRLEHWALGGVLVLSAALLVWRLRRIVRARRG